MLEPGGWAGGGRFRSFLDTIEFNNYKILIQLLACKISHVVIFVAKVLVLVLSITGQRFIYLQLYSTGKIVG